MNIKINCKKNEQGAWCKDKRVKRSLFGLGARCCVLYPPAKKACCEYQEKYERPSAPPKDLKGGQSSDSSGDLLRENEILKEQIKGLEAQRESLLSEHGCSWDECGRLRQIRDEIRADRDRLRKQLSEYDCLYTGGSVAESGGVHCPVDDPCMKCRLERAEKRIEELEEWKAEALSTKKGPKVPVDLFSRMKGKNYEG